jgi:hypothetical protein
MIAAVNTYHYVGPLNARRQLVPRPNFVWKATAEITSRLSLRALLSLRAQSARCMRQHGHFGLAEQD